ncbi:MAG: hypothetical protein GC131_00295 [Alphaproteobacteria bacterium]|nr:hypothetical protein [Alphaproteobacteria bacterium]
MKLRQKHLVLQVIMVLYACIGLTACADVEASWLTGEPDEDVTGDAASYPGIERIGQQGEEWPHLGMVPERPGNIPPPGSFDDEKQALEANYDNAKEIQQRYIDLQQRMQKQNTGAGVE